LVTKPNHQSIKGKIPAIVKCGNLGKEWVGNREDNNLNKTKEYQRKKREDHEHTVNG
jgi:hypothetical protein